MLLRSVLLGATICLSAPVYAGNMIIDVNQVITGTAPASSTLPWLRATFSDVVGGVQLTMQALNLTGTEFVSKWGFNLNTAYNPSNLVLSFVSGQAAANSTANANCCKLGGNGGGSYDIEFGFATSNSGGNRFTAGETSQYLFSGISGLAATDFSFLSSAATKKNPLATTTWYSAAHVQSIGRTGKSGWIGGDVAKIVTPQPPGSPVPEPQSWMLFGTVAAGLAFAVRRRRKQTA